MGQTGGHKIANFVFLHYISFILAFTALECIKRYWKIVGKSFGSLDIDIELKNISISGG